MTRDRDGIIPGRGRLRLFWGAQKAERVSVLAQIGGSRGVRQDRRYWNRKERGRGGVLGVSEKNYKVL